MLKLNIIHAAFALLVPVADLFAQEKPAVMFNPADFVGIWVTAEKNGIKTCEDWVSENPHQLRGRSYRVKGADTTLLEWVDLHVKGNRVLYIPTTAGQNDGNPIPFTLESVQERTYIFTNPQHDFPKRIVYVFDGRNRLHAWIDDGSDKQRIHFYYSRYQR
jgi:hypothetical protein